MSQFATVPEERPIPADSSELVFVYGGLRRGGAEAFRMIEGRFLRMGEVAGTLLEISGTPGFVPRRGAEKGWVTGDVFEVSRDHLKTLDATGESSEETGGGNYTRVRTQVYLPGSPIDQGEAWIWQWNDLASTARIVRSGDWMDISHPRAAPWCTITAGFCLLGFFVSMHHLNSTFPPAGAGLRFRQALFLFISMVPIVACAMAGWAFLRRERCEVLTVLVMVVAALISLPFGLSIIAELLSRFVRLF